MIIIADSSHSETEPGIIDAIMNVSIKIILHNCLLISRLKYLNANFRMKRLSLIMLFKNISFDLQRETTKNRKILKKLKISQGLSRKNMKDMLKREKIIRF